MLTGVVLGVLSWDWFATFDILDQLSTSRASPAPQCAPRRYASGLLAIVLERFLAP
jgi:hypothetical protein